MRQFARTQVAPATAPKPDAAARGVASHMLVLQQTVGNRAVTQLIGQRVVQRHLEPTAAADVAGAVAEAPTEEAAATTEAAATSEIEPGTGTTGKTGTATLKGDVRKKAINDAMRASATGMWALGVIEKWSIPVDYEFAGPGAFHSAGKIYLDKAYPIGAAALVLMHEAQHADTFKSGKAADIETLGRAEYIKKKIADEAEAVVRQIEGMAVTKGLGLDITGAGVTENEKKRYLTAFYAKRDELRKANPKMSTAEINAICRTHVRDTEVTSWFHDGTFVTSGKKQIPYSDHYGGQWDDEHKPPAAK